MMEVLHGNSDKGGRKAAKNVSLPTNTAANNSSLPFVLLHQATHFNGLLRRSPNLNPDNQCSCDNSMATNRRKETFIR